MIRHIPEYILNSYEKGQFSGTIPAYVLLFDIAGFTSISTELQKYGKQGAEELSLFLDFIFGKPIDIVKSYGGFISLFAGDAFCAIFPEEYQDIISAVNAIRAFFRDTHTSCITLASFDIIARQTVVYGELKWQIYENEIQNEYVFYGEPIKELAGLACYKDEILFSDAAADRLGVSQFQKTSNGYKLLSSKVDTPKNPLIYVYDSETLKKFENPGFSSEIPPNEIRSAAFCFANLENIIPEHIGRTLQNIHKSAVKYGGLVNKLDASDKGLIAIILFGLPKSEGNTLYRICDFSLELMNLEPQLALGLSCGTVYAGFTGSKETREYTALGHPMNLSSRLMSKAMAGEILVDNDLHKELHKVYLFDYPGKIELKGVSHPVNYYKLSHRTKSPTDIQDFSFVGRKDELRQIIAEIQTSYTQKDNTVIYVSGDPGTGKSRLVKEALRNFETFDIHYFRVSCNSIIKTPLDAIKQIVRSYFGINQFQSQDDAMLSFRSKWNTCATDDKEMVRIESIIASLMDFEWDSSVWELLPPNEKPYQLHSAIIHFFRYLCFCKPVLLHLDDGQWLDDDSKEILQRLSNDEVSPFLIVSACRYLDDGNRVDLELPKHSRIDIELGNLDRAACDYHIRSIFGLPSIPVSTLKLIYEKSMGNPLFVEQLCSYLHENDILDEQGNITTEPAFLASFSSSDIVCNRIDRLSEKVRTCIYGASVLGMEFNTRVLSQMLNNDLSTELDIGIRSRIWRDLDALNYIFTHIMIKDIVYQRMLSNKLKNLHSIAAIAMEMVFSENCEEHAEAIAMHFEKALLDEKAAFYYHKAGCRYREKFSFSQSEINLDKALAIRKKLYGTNHPDTAASLTAMAILDWNRGHYEKAETLYIKALEIYRTIYGEEHSDTVIALHHLAVLYWNLGHYDKAEPLLLRSLELFERIYGTDHSNTAASLAGLGELYSQQGSYDLAIPLFIRALAIYDKIYGTEHPDIAISLNSLAVLYNEQGHYDKAKPLHLRALQIREKLLGSEHPDTAASLNNLALLYKNQELYEEATPLYTRALNIFEKVLGAEHPYTAAAMEGLGELYSLKADFANAEPMYLRALEIMHQGLGAMHPWTIEVAKGVEGFYLKMGNQAKVEHYRSMYLGSRDTIN